MSQETRAIAKSPKRVWYLRARYEHPATNEYIVKIIGEQNGEYLHKDVCCSDGVRRNLFECPKGYEDVRAAIAAKRELGLHFEVYFQQNGGAIAPFVIWKRSHRRNAQAIAQINRMKRQARNESEKK